MFKRMTARRIHLWIAITVSIPMVLMAVTGVLIAMRSMTAVQVPMAWLGSESVPERLPIMAYLEHADGSVWIGNAKGLSRVSNGQVEEIQSFAGQEIVGLAQVAQSPNPVVGTRMAIWANSDGQWVAVKRGRVRQLGNLPQGGVLAIVGGRGELADGKPWFTADGAQWDIYKKAMATNGKLPALENPKVQLHQFMREIHSGAFMMGKGPGEMIWGGIFGAVLITISMTGLWMWIRRERQRRSEA